MIKKPFYSIFQGEFNDYAFDVDCNQQSECCRTLPVDYNQHRMHFLIINNYILVPISILIVSRYSTKEKKSFKKIKKLKA